MTSTEERPTACREMADDILKRITWYPESYDQTTWQTVARGFLKKLMPRGGDTRQLFKSAKAKAKSVPTLQNCQTTGCIAGTASIIAGDIPAIAAAEDTVTGFGHLSVSSVITEDGETRNIQDRGAELLCLTSAEHQWLFAGGRSLLEVVNALREISAGKPLSLRSEFDMTPAEKQEIRAYRHMLKQQQPKMNYVSTNRSRMVPRSVRERIAAEKARAAGQEVRPDASAR